MDKSKGTQRKNVGLKTKPKARAKAIAHTVIKAGLSAIPIVGGPAAEIFSAIIVPPLTKRRNEWIESIAQGLKILEEKIEGFNIESLSKNEMFITTVMHASQAAICNHQKEKLEALRNAVLNAALPNAPEENIQLLFLSLVDILTPWHLKILKFLDDIDKLSSRVSLIDRSFFMVSYEFGLDKIVKDLFAHGLTTTESLPWDLKDLFDKRTNQTNQIEYRVVDHPSLLTPLGKRFLSFIKFPIQEKV